MDLGHMNGVLKWMYLYVGSGLRTLELEWLLLLRIVYYFGGAFSAGWVGVTVVFVVPEPI